MLPDDPVLETVTTLDCTTLQPKSAFNFGDTVCAKIEGGPPLSIYPRRFSWVAPNGVVQRQVVVTALGDVDQFTIPPRGADDLREVWRINSITPRSSVRASAFFTVSDPQNPSANLSIYDNINFNTSNLTGGTDVEFALYVINRGPDPALNVQVVDVGTNSTFVDNSETITGAGFTCAPSAGGVTCTIASLPPGSKTRIGVTYHIAAGAQLGTVVTNSATISSATADARPLDNSSGAKAEINIESDSNTCEIVCPRDITVAADRTVGGVRGALVNFDSETTGDCGRVTSSPAAGTFFPAGATTTVTLTATVIDANNNSTVGDTCTFTVTVTDTTAPTIVCNGTINKDAGGACSVDLIIPEMDISELTPPTASGGVGEVKVDGDRSDGDALDAPYPVGSTTITWTATDEIGRTATCLQTVVVTGAPDTTPPTITAPADVVAYTGAVGASCGRIVNETELGTPLTDDNCVGGISIKRLGIPNDGTNTNAGNFFPIGETILTYTAKDKAGNESQPVTQKVTVIDNTPPIIFAPADASYVCASAVPAGLPSQASGPDLIGANDVHTPGPPSDNCGTPVVTVSDSSTGAGSASNPLVITRTFRATDSAGNYTDAIQTITVIDSTPPTITSVPADVSVSTGPGATSCGTDVSNATLGTATATDNCEVTVTRSPTGNTFAVGTTNVVWTATDAAGNTATGTQHVTVTDNTPPVVTPPANVTVYLPLNSTATSMAVTYSPATATDNCAVAGSISYSKASGSTFSVGTTTVTASATDIHGNTGSATFTVTVLYNFTGFFSPVGNIPTLNAANAGKAIPVKFSLSGNKGLNIFATGNPYSVSFNCNSNDPGTDITETVNAGGSSLSFGGDQYNYVWKTESSWANTCRQLVLTLNDGSVHRANFKFK
jgi:hypothetical protein